ncbi:GspE/PulE family protein [Noviherbaspirillum galbum]|uniref:Flp pilus assembly complex ATPase component n=1 Tax=Noviherbaspirillum galbum TaxID=2709383 RepID=A0A6B3SZL1_9BURK|nr:ATPase, T2SS/T4P/T4SS family [Noviherbaspirillum galbum]NEX64219.1 Flp pilus assembly complex ATPase component [Noviherbaspirillum galbum]
MNKPPQFPHAAQADAQAAGATMPPSGQRHRAWYDHEVQEWSELDFHRSQVSLYADPTLARLTAGEHGKEICVFQQREGKVTLLVTRNLLARHRTTFDNVLTVLERQRLEVVKHVATASVIRYAVDYVASQHQASTDRGLSQSSALREFLDVVREAALRGSSDIHFCAREGGAVILFRVEGQIVRSGRPLSYRRCQDLIRAVYNSMPDKGSNSGSLITFETQQRAAIPCEVDINGKAEALKLRFQITPALGGFDAVMRILWQSGVSFQKGDSLKSDLVRLGYLDDQATRISLAAMKTAGGIVLAGVTGSGKTTTLYSMLGHIATETKKTYSVEDPIEGKLQNVSQIQVQTTEDMDTDQAISEIVKSLMRLDPDVTMVSEIRGIETGSAFKQLIQTGHQTLSTVHASSALDIYERLAAPEIGIPRHVLSSPDFLTLLIYQKLLRKLCEHCKIPLRESDLPQDKIASCELLGDTGRMYVTNLKGCPHCSGAAVKGVAGRTVCAEVILPDHTLLRLLQEERSIEGYQHLRQRIAPLHEPSSRGKQALEVAIYKMCEGIIDPREVEQEFQPLELYVEMTNYDRRAGKN